MKRRYEKCRVLIMVVCLITMVIGCASTNKSTDDGVVASKESVPKWITDQGRLVLFPDSIYISQLGYGNSAQESKEKACVNISEYIKTTVEATSHSSYFYQEKDASYSESREVRETTSISTGNNLYKIEYTNPYYFEDFGQYVCVAFINKEQAFNFVKPKLDVVKKEFPVAYSKALEDTSLLGKIIRIRKAQELLLEFYEVYDFARAMSPKARDYEEVDFFANESYMKVKELSSSVLINIEGVGDTVLLENSGVVPELAHQFEKLGFVVGTSLKSNCLALVEVKSTITKTQETFETYPEISIRVIEKGAEKISYTRRLSKVAGFDRATVERRRNLAWITEIQTSFVKECL